MATFCFLICCRFGWCCNYCKKTLTIKEFSDSSLNLIHGTFFELVICVSCSMWTLPYSDYFTDADWVSVVLQFIFAAIALCYVLFVTYFTVAKTGLW